MEKAAGSGLGRPVSPAPDEIRTHHHRGESIGHQIPSALTKRPPPRENSVKGHPGIVNGQENRLRAILKEPIRGRINRRRTAQIRSHGNHTGTEARRLAFGGFRLVWFEHPQPASHRFPCCGSFLAPGNPRKKKGPTVARQPLFDVPTDKPSISFDASPSSRCGPSSSRKGSRSHDCGKAKASRLPSGPWRARRRGCRPRRGANTPASPCPR